MTKEHLETMRSLVEQVSAHLAADIELEFKYLFSGLFAYVEGRAFASMSTVGLALKLPPDSQVELLQHTGAKYLQYEINGPIHREYVVVSPEFHENHELLAHWIERSINHALSLPVPKKRKGKG
jgi:TfoX/Sxy family transcriptional regulator of competence genes